MTRFRLSARRRALPLVLVIVLGGCADSATVPEPAPPSTPILTVDIQPGRSR